MRRKFKFKLHEILVEELVDHISKTQGLRKVFEDKNNQTKATIVEHASNRLHNYNTRENLEVREFISNLGIILDDEDLTEQRVEEAIRQTAKNFYDVSITVECAVLEGNRYCDANKDRRDVIKLVNDSYLKALENQYAQVVIDNRRKAMFSKIEPNLYDKIFAEHVLILNENGTTHSQINENVLQGIRNFTRLEVVTDKVLDVMFGKQ